MVSQKDTIPRIGKALLWLLLDEEDYHQIVGDFEEVYRYRNETRSRVNAARSSGIPKEVTACAWARKS